jgi:hypothetical protein
LKIHGAFSPFQIDALLADPATRMSALAYLAECTRLMEALGPLASTRRGAWHPSAADVLRIVLPSILARAPG